MSAFALLRIADRLRATRLSDSHELGEIFECLRELRSGQEGDLDAEMVRRLEASGMLVGYLARMGELGGEDVRVIALRLLRDAADGMGGPRGAAGSGKRPASESATDLLGDMMLGQILLRAGDILEEHIHQALKVQRSTGQALGEILVKIGACSRAQVQAALTQQSRLRRARRQSYQDPRRLLENVEARGTGLKIVGEVMLGELLIQRGVITRRQLERALEVQKKDGARIGEALVKIGATTMEQIEQALRIQGRDRRFGIKQTGEGEG
ncbi:MAG TPA: hypothetical protein VF530_18345 [Planctomycetota bacterium]